MSISLILNNNITKMNIIKKKHNYTYACSMCHVSSNQLDKANQSKGRQVKSCMNCPDRNNNVDLLPYKDTNCQG